MIIEYPETSGKMKKLSVMLICTILCLVGFVACSGGAYIILETPHNHDTVSERTQEYLNNMEQSQAIYYQAIAPFQSDAGRYTDDFGGVFYDNNGFLNINITGNRTPFLSDYLIYNHVDFSYNFLSQIQDELIPVMLRYSIWAMGSCEYCNKVDISILDKSQITEVITYLRRKRLYADNSLSFFVGENNFVEV